MDTDGLGWFARLRERLNTGLGKLAALTAALLILGGSVVFFVTRKGGSQQHVNRIVAGGKTVTFLCGACGESGQTHIAWGEPFPVPCPKCGKRQAVSAFKCFGCKQTIAARSDPLWNCPRCNHLYDNRLKIEGEIPERVEKK